MNSLPLISHHLFVAAVGNESRAPERPVRHVRLSGAVVAPAPAITIGAPDGRRPVAVELERSWRVSLASAGG